MLRRVPGLRAAVARVRLARMTESIPFWEDWRLWQIVVTGVLAFLGFTFGTWIKHHYDLRLDRIREDKERLFLAHVIQAEMISLKAHASTSVAVAEDLQAAGEPPTAAEVVSLDLVSTSFAHQAGIRLGLLGHANTVNIFRALLIAAHFHTNMEAVRRLDPAKKVPLHDLAQYIEELTAVVHSCVVAAESLSDITERLVDLTPATDIYATPQAPTE